MDTGQQILKNTSKLALAALAMLFILSIVFYRERIFFSDASFILFTVINNKTFYIQEHRWGSFITQMVPYFGQRLHVPITTIIVGYAVSFNLFYLSVASLLYKVRQYALVILMSLYYFLFVSASYFWTNNEIHQAIAWMFLLYGTTIWLGYRKTNSAVTILTFAILGFFTVFTHYVVIIPTVFLLVFFILEKKHWPFSGKQSAVLCSILALLIALKFIDTHSHANAYDTLHLHGLTHFSLRDVIHSFVTPEVLRFLYRCLYNYWLAMIIFICGITTLIRHKELRPAVWVCISSIGYLIIMGLIYGDPGSNILLFHIESEWASLAVIVGAAFVFSFLPRLQTATAQALLATIFAVRLVYILLASSSFSARIDLNEQVLGQMRKKGITKLCLVNDAYLQSVNSLSWSLPYESLMLSAIAGDKPHCTFFFINGEDKDMVSKVTGAYGYYDAYQNTPPQAVSQYYFTVDTTKPYQVLSYPDLMK